VGEIKRSVLVEGEKSVISQRITTQLTLAAFAPKVQAERHLF
jgi:hypothetical protein